MVMSVCLPLAPLHPLVRTLSPLIMQDSSPFQITCCAAFIPLCMGPSRGQRLGRGHLSGAFALVMWSHQEKHTLPAMWEPAIHPSVRLVPLNLAINM